MAAGPLGGRGLHVRVVPLVLERPAVGKPEKVMLLTLPQNVPEIWEIPVRHRRPWTRRARGVVARVFRVAATYR